MNRSILYLLFLKCLNYFVYRPLYWYSNARLYIDIQWNTYVLTTGCRQYMHCDVKCCACVHACVCDRAILRCSHALAGCSFPFRNQPLSELLNHTRSQPLRRKLITFPTPSPPLIFSTFSIVFSVFSHTNSIEYVKLKEKCATTLETLFLSFIAVF